MVAKNIIVIPTYDERENVVKMADALLQCREDVAVLFVDDNSPDGTGEVIEKIARENPRIMCLHREKKEGLGRAYIAGFKKALELGAEKIIQMDCDFSHNPEDIARLLNSDADLVIGSRYVKGGGTHGWPFKRRLISRAGGIFIRAVTGMKLKDPTGGFKCWKRSTLKAVDLDTIRSMGYSFQLEMNYFAWKNGFKIVEIPIFFTDRERGYSKITPGIAWESVKVSLMLRFGKRRKI